MRPGNEMQKLYSISATRIKGTRSKKSEASVIVNNKNQLGTERLINSSQLSPTKKSKTY